MKSGIRQAAAARIAERWPGEVRLTSRVQFGRWLTDLRERRGFSGHELSEAAGHGAGYLSRAERMTQDFPLTTAIRLADALGYDVVLRPRSPEQSLSPVSFPGQDAEMLHDPAMACEWVPATRTGSAPVLRLMVSDIRPLAPTRDRWRFTVAVELYGMPAALRCRRFIWDTIRRWRP